MAYDSALPQNGVNMNVGAPISVPYTRFGAQPVSSYAMPGSQWVPGYMMAQPMAQVDDQVIFFSLAYRGENSIFSIMRKLSLFVMPTINSTCKWHSILA